MGDAGIKSYAFSLIHEIQGKEKILPQVKNQIKPYYTTSPGILKCTQIVLNLLLFVTIIVSQERNLGQFSFLSLTGGVGFILTTIFFVSHQLNLSQQYEKIPWMKIEIIYTSCWTVLLGFGSIACLIKGGYGPLFGLVPFLGMNDAVVYGYEFHWRSTKLKKWKRSKESQKKKQSDEDV